MNKSILSYSYASDEVKGYKESEIAKSEKNDCFVRAVASATGSHYDSAHSFVKETFDRKHKKGTMFMEGTMKKLEDSGFSIDNKNFIASLFPEPIFPVIAIFILVYFWLIDISCHLLLFLTCSTFQKRVLPVQ